MGFVDFRFGCDRSSLWHIGIVEGWLQWGLRRPGLASFCVLFGALKTIAHPLAHDWFVTQLHSAGNLRRQKRTKAASTLAFVWRERPARVTEYSIGE